MTVPSILKRIVERKKEEVVAAQSRHSQAGLERRIQSRPPARGFERALKQALVSGPGIIAEIKKASPSAGVIREDFHPDAIARSYEAAGAACLSVLTDRDFFKGHDQYLEEAREACGLPVLRKDFMIDPWQIIESRALGADCILLIAAVLDQSLMKDLLALARDLGMDALVEVHDEAEMERALSLDHELIGVNNRNLNTFETSLATSERLKAMMAPGSFLVTESGIKTVQDVKRMQAAGINAFLVGEAFMREADPGRALKQLFF